MSLLENLFKVMNNPLALLMGDHDNKAMQEYQEKLIAFLVMLDDDKSISKRKRTELLKLLSTNGLDFAFGRYLNLLNNKSLIEDHVSKAVTFIKAISGGKMPPWVARMDFFKTAGKLAGSKISIIEEEGDANKLEKYDTTIRSTNQLIDAISNSKRPKPMTLKEFRRLSEKKADLQIKVDEITGENQIDELLKKVRDMEESLEREAA